MSRARYRQRLQDLRADVTAMGETVLDRYETAVTLLESHDTMVADRVVARDAELNRWYLDIERECVRLLALEQPVASDLRFVTASFKIVTDLERVGDLAVNLAEYGSEGAGGGFGTPSDGSAGEATGPNVNHGTGSNAGWLPVDVVPIAMTAGEMLAAAIRAYATEDAAAAREIAARDDDLDAACTRAGEELTRALLTARATDVDGSDEHLEAATRTLLAIREVERVGDHAVNVCARTLSMLEHDHELIY